MEETIWRFSASSASSRGVQASTGRPASAGGVHAMAMIWTICSGVKVGGAPGRGASASTAAISVRSPGSSASRAARSGAAAAQRARQRRAVLGEQPSCCAICSLGRPASAARMIWMRRTRACGAVCWRSKRSRIARCGGEMVIGIGGGPGIGLLSDTQNGIARGCLSTAGLYRNPVGIWAELD